MMRANKIDALKEFSKTYPRISRPLKDFLFYMVNNNPEKRYTAEQLIKHKYIVSNLKGI